MGPFTFTFAYISELPKVSNNQSCQITKIVYFSSLLILVCGPSLSPLLKIFKHLLLFSPYHSMHCSLQILLGFLFWDRLPWNSPASASWVLWFKMCATMPGSTVFMSALILFSYVSPSGLCPFVRILTHFSFDSSDHLCSLIFAAKTWIFRSFDFYLVWFLFRDGVSLWGPGWPL